MIRHEDVLSLTYFKKTVFTGSSQGMCYLMKKEDRDDHAVLLAVWWPGPYNSETTPEEQKHTKEFPFTPEGKDQAVDWLNEEFSQERKN